MISWSKIRLNLVSAHNWALFAIGFGGIDEQIFVFFVAEDFEVAVDDDVDVGGGFALGEYVLLPQILHLFKLLGKLFYLNYRQMVEIRNIHKKVRPIVNFFALNFS